jgi:hypothetical protein
MSILTPAKIGGDGKSVQSLLIVDLSVGVSFLAFDLIRGCKCLWPEKSSLLAMHCLLSDQERNTYKAL